MAHALCKTCRHREKLGIELALARGVAFKAVARRYVVSEQSVRRHARDHMPPQLRAKLIAGPSIEGIDLDKLRERESQSLLMNLIGLRNRLFAAFDLGEEHGDNQMLARISGQIHTNLEITAKLLGDISTGSTINNILIQPQYVELRVALVGALAGFPDARRAVAQVLHTIENKVADAIKADTRELAT